MPTVPRGQRPEDHVKEENPSPRFLSEGEKSVLDKYKDEVQSTELEAYAKKLEADKKVYEDELKASRLQLKKLRKTSLSKATIAKTMGTMSITSLMTLVIYYVMVKLVYRPALRPGDDTLNPKLRGRRKRRRPAQEEESPLALGPARTEFVVEQPVKKRTRVR